ncbi:hypothetical protein BDV34DRAFT_231515 [Aspergillus parasiticus]|uniref:Uncharacterized protein n=1 Tax=Aspergillus parasiticus TaxID=5067 RepID=A0A5N6D1I8_ASPPA|nr:hypothetical protein BDV34DRAFT_231515 [Aspergillus parasiticus]
MIPLLKTHILPNCFEPKPEWRTFDFHGTIYWKSDPAASTPTITTTPDGTVVLTLKFQSGEYTDKKWTHLDGVSAKTSSSINVSFTGKAILISQRFVFWSHVWKSALREELSGNLADWTPNSTYDIAVNAKGKLEVRPPKTDPLIDSSLVLTGSGYLEVATIIKRDVSDQVKLQVAPLEPIPVTFAQNFVFPGGNTFILKDSGLSAYQDLVSHITYADLLSIGDGLEFTVPRVTLPEKNTI